ncbi:MAG: protein kinase [Synechococcales cyanobacterium RU_4_20]|nr:protein kinase [Synechococcales cyanobacterium RU_4_20]
MQIVLELLSGLSHAHDRGIIHCDVKPENILLSLKLGGWSPKLTDFGIAYNQSSPKPSISSSPNLGSPDLDSPVFGSPAYMAPELFRGEISPAVDLYAMGIILYEILVGNRPFRGTPSQLQHAHQRQPLPLPPNLPQEQQSLLLCALAKRPGQRFSSAVVLAEVLGEIVRSLLAQPERAPTEPAPTALFEPIQLPLQPLTAQPISASITASIAASIATSATPALSAIAPDHSWQAQVEPVGSHPSRGLVQQTGQGIPPTRQLRCFRRETRSRPQQLPPTLAGSMAGSILILDRRHGVVWSSSPSATQLILFNRRGGILAPIRVAVPITQVVRSHQPLHLLAIEAPSGPAPPNPTPPILLKISLRPLRLQRIPLAIAPVSLLSLAWGVVLIDAQGQLLLLDHEGQPLAQAAVHLGLPTEPAIAPLQVQLLPVNEREVAIIQSLAEPIAPSHPTATEPVQIHRVCLNDLKLDLIF